MIGVATRRHRRAPRASAGQWSPLAASDNVLPFDYVATFNISGQPGNVIEDVINVGPEGVFVAVAVSYGFDADRTKPLVLGLPQRERLVFPGDITLGQIPPQVLIEGFRLNPAVEHLAIGDDGELTQQSVPRDLAAKALQRVIPPEPLSFLFSMIDSGTGRELQDEPTHNLASLGSGSGERPFRPLARPITFLPRSTVRVQITEQSLGTRGKLYVVLQGYKIFGMSNCPEPIARRLQGSRACPIETIGNPHDRVIPFDYVARAELTGRAGNRIETEVAINVEGGFVATAIGYGLQPAAEPLDIHWERRGALNGEALKRRWTETGTGNNRRTLADADFNTWPPTVLADLRSLPLRFLPVQALRDGLRLRPDILRLAFGGASRLGRVAPTETGQLFQTLNTPADVSFRFELMDTGSGRDLQNQPIHNVAGLGIATGERPFKRLARPMILRPRSTIRVNVEERFGRGTLHIVFQGYKILGQLPGGVP